MRHFSDVRVIDRLGEASDFSLSHGRAVELAAEHALADIGTFEAEKAAKHQPRAGGCPWSCCSDFESRFLISFVGLHAIFAPDAFVACGQLGLLLIGFRRPGCSPQLERKDSKK
jgi:hypothetical protein